VRGLSGKYVREGKSAGSMAGTRQQVGATWAGDEYAGNSLAAEGSFNPRVPVRADDTSGDLQVWADIPKRLKRRLEKNAAKVTEDCLRSNADTILKFLEVDVLDHVVRLAVDSKAMKALLKRDHEAELADPEAYKQEAGSRLARSSLLGRNPFGDFHPDDDLVNEDGTLTDAGNVIKSVQDKAYHYARVHLKRVVSRSIWADVKAHEQVCKDDPRRVIMYHNGRIPWRVYKDIVLEDLPKADGLYELGILVSMERETGNDAKRWVQRINTGRSILGQRMGCNLSDAIYVSLVMRYLTTEEKNDMAKAHVASTGRHISPERALARIRQLSWTDFQAAVASDVAAQRAYRGGAVTVPFREKVYSAGQVEARQSKRARRTSSPSSRHQKNRRGGGDKELNKQNRILLNTTFPEPVVFQFFAIRLGAGLPVIDFQLITGSTNA